MAYGQNTFTMPIGNPPRDEFPYRSPWSWQDGPRSPGAGPNMGPDTQNVGSAFAGKVGNPYTAQPYKNTGAVDDEDAGKGPSNSGGIDSRVQEILGKYPGYQSFRDEGEYTTLRDQYYGTDQTKWADAQVGRQKMDEDQLRNTAMGDIASAGARAESNLAMRGGLSGGARERLARSGAGDEAARMQEIARGGMQARADIGIGDEANKASGRQNLVGLTAQDVGGRNQWDLDRANMEMKAMAAGYTADAYRDAAEDEARSREAEIENQRKEAGSFYERLARGDLAGAGKSFMSNMNPGSTEFWTNPNAIMPMPPGAGLGQADKVLTGGKVSKGVSKATGGLF